ncbi:MAG: family epimerase/isomerase [Caulobacter sp.]|nr:family epimerase/isomerase [Caulobacter sp.]
MPTPFEDARDVRNDLRAWLLDYAYPLWWEAGTDHERGGFFEKIDQTGLATAAPRRARVQPRQIYAFAVASGLGWNGPAKEAVEQGLDFYLKHYRRSDGLMRTLVDASGEALDDSVDLYDQAFALFGLATAYKMLGGGDLKAAAVTLRDELIATLKHPVAGFEEANPRTLPLQSNPHMHLFEACLAWDEAGGDPEWRVLADEIANLALTKFIDADSGAIREFFDGDWGPAPGVQGRIAEPGHQFEWGWLLLRWSRLTGRRDAQDAALRMIAIGEGPGVDRERGVAINQLLTDMSVHDPVARLWPQTERIKAGALSAEITGNEAGWTLAADAGRGLLKYFETPVRGLWWDRYNPDGTFTNEPAPASSFYHIVCAIHELDRAIDAAT